MGLTKVCTLCKREIFVSDFYWSGKYMRSECKNCTIRKNWKYAQENKTWLKRSPKRIAYFKKYYERNKKTGGDNTAHNKGTWQ